MKSYETRRREAAAKPRLQRGGALLAVLGFALLATAIVLLSLTESQTQLARVKLDKNRRLARLAAEVGIQASLSRLKQGLDGDCDGRVEDLFRAQGVALSQGGSGLANGDPTQTSLFSEPGARADADEDGFKDFEEGDSFAAQRVAFAARPSGSFASRVQEIAPDTYRVRCMAVDDGLVRVFEAVVKPEELRLPGLVSRRTLRIGTSVLIDTYDSTSGYFPLLKLLVINGLSIFDGGGLPILQTYDRAEGEVYAQDGVISSANARVLSDVLLGPTGTSSGSGLFGAINTVSDPIDPPPPSFDPPAINDNADPGFASFYNSLTGSLLISPTQTAALGADGTATTYVLPGGLRGLSASEMVIRGDVTLYVADGLVLDAGSALTMAADSTLTIVSDGRIDFAPAVSYLGSQRPADLRILQAGSDPINLAPTTALRASIESPLANVNLAAGLQFFGAIVGQDVDISTLVQYHWDETLTYISGSRGRLGLSVVIEVE